MGAARWRVRGLGWWEGALASLARRRRLAVCAVALAPLILRAMLLPWHPVPEPRVHDEFTLLFGADTLASGRLMNPQPPAWAHFETMHLLVRPVFASSFPLGPSIALATGQVIFGNPWIGIWLSVAFLCGAICWMLQGWLPPRWALLGGVLVALRFGVASYWMDSYWGGSLAAAGGAVALGALVRLWGAPRWQMGVAMGVGFVILANTRPFEGGVFALGVLVWLAVRPGRALRRAAIPLALVAAMGAGSMAYYNHRVTGRAGVLPYALYRETMSVAPHFVWQSTRPAPLYNNRETRDFYLGWELHDYQLAREQFFDGLRIKAGAYWRFYFGPLLTIPLLALPWVWRNREARAALALLGVVAAALAVEVWHHAHYAAPATGLAVLVALMSMRRLRLWGRRGRKTGLALVRCLPVSCVLLMGWHCAARPVATARARIARQLARSADQHLILVRYGLRHDPGDEWVYNRADIAAAQVIWARELDRTSNLELLRCFPGRHTWLVEPDRAAPRLVPYSTAPARNMPFVAVGAPGIAVLQSAAGLRRSLAPVDATVMHSCEVWNFYFTEATGVDGPDTSRGCYTPGDRARPVSFEHWFEWLSRQR
jgi:hypothetical protein